MKNEIIIFENQNVKLEVNMKDETVWLTQAQMAELFGKDRRTITRHIQNIYEDGELEQNQVCSFFEHTANDGKIYNTQYYNLDMIISVGYRVKSQNGITFRRWANKILKDYLIKGYAVNEKRLEYLEKTVKLIDIASRNLEGLDTVGASDIIKVLQRYTKSLDLLDDYDHKTLTKPKGNISFDGKDVYESVEEKAANFLYTCVKNHIFIDGNKRIAATLFIYFLQFYNILYVNNQAIIDNNTLASLTLLIAESNPREKEILIQLVMNFLT